MDNVSGTMGMGLELLYSEPIKRRGRNAKTLNPKANQRPTQNPLGKLSQFLGYGDLQNKPPMRKKSILIASSGSAKSPE